MRSFQRLVHEPDTTKASPPAPAARPGDPVDEQSPWRDSSIELVQGLDVIEAPLETLPSEFQGIFE